MNSLAALSRRQAFLFAGSALLAPVLAGAAGAPAPGLPELVSLADALTDALGRAQPLIVLVSLEGCPYCRIARENYLLPMRQRDGLAVWQINMRSAGIVRDFADNALSQDEMIQRWGVHAAPTVLFFGRDGREVAERLKGVSPDFYSSYLDQRIAAAQAAVRAAK